ncbi:hypothetical protein BDF19DRAFT_416409 [Syncephalis fuscata]|nr:hypothetical protein BDF19DRAFT_416409 [Syncephalis fuscata]
MTNLEYSNSASPAINPLGEISGFDFVVQAHDDLKEARERMFGLTLQLSILVVILYIFIWETIRSVRLVRLMSNGFSTWCCLAQALTGTIVNLINLINKISSWPTCRHQMYVDAVGLSIGRMSINALLLAKAYYVNGKDRRLLIIGCLAMLPEPSIAYIIIAQCQYAVTAVGSCSLLYPAWFPWVYSALDVPIHIVFSAAFIFVVVRQYRLLGLAAWEKLQNDSITYLLGIVVFKIIMLLIVASRVAGDATATLALVEWVICSLLVIKQQESIREAFKKKTQMQKYMLKKPTQYKYASLVGPTRFN